MNIEKPFIKLLKSPNSGYFFDVNRNEIIAVSDKAYEFLEKEQEEKECLPSAEVSAELELLRENGYLSGNKVKEIRHPLTDYIDTLIGRNIEKIALQITQDCNFRCDYCAYSYNLGTQRKHQKRKMDFKVAKDSLDFLWEHSVDSEEVCVGFYGGEPLIEFELVKKIVEYADEIFFGRKLLYTITTNASLLSNEIVDFFCKHNFSVLISIDGPKEIHDRHRVFAESRKGTFDTVIKKISNACNYSEKFAEKLSINIVMDPSNDLEKVQALINENAFFKSARIQSTIIDDDFSITKNEYREEFTSKYRYSMFVATLHALGIVSKKYVSPIGWNPMVSFLDKREKMIGMPLLPEKLAPGGPCIPGKMRPMVTVDGKILPCERVSEISQCMILGDVYNEISIDKVFDLINIGQLTAERCKNCWAFINCGICARCADNDGKLSGKHKNLFCDQDKARFLSFLERIVLFNEFYSTYLFKGVR